MPLNCVAQHKTRKKLFEILPLSPEKLNAFNYFYDPCHKVTGFYGSFNFAVKGKVSPNRQRREDGSHKRDSFHLIKFTAF